MKKVININFKGRVIPIEEFAYDILNKYVESLRKLFANEEGKDEIINDIEDRIAELFAEVLKKGNTCITETDVNKILLTAWADQRILMMKSLKQVLKRKTHNHLTKHIVAMSLKECIEMKTIKL